MGTTHGVTASQLGSLNASHASPQGFAHASANSVVGQLGAYAAALNAAAVAQAQNNTAAFQAALANAAMALAQASNHSLSATTVTAVNGNLGSSGVLGPSGMALGNAQAAGIAAAANTDQAAGVR